MFKEREISVSIICIESIRDFIVSYGNMSDLARRAGVDRTVLYHILNGYRNPGIKVIDGLVKAGMRKEDVFR